jgi:signal transduction histidine kinase
MNRIEIDGYSFCSIIISDTGKGIPEELRGRIFESFITGEQVFHSGNSRNGRI